MFLINLLAFAGAALVLAMIPGPSTAVVLRQTLRSGRRAAFAATIANEVGLLFWALVAAFGLSALVSASQLAYDLIRLIGAFVLISLGVQSLWRARSKEAVDGAEPVIQRAIDAPISSTETRRAFRAGLVTIVANPKAAVFAASFLPQFVPPHAPVLPTLVLLAILWVVVDLSWYVVLSWLVSRAHSLFTRPSLRRRLEQLTGLALLGFGTRLAFEHR